MILTTEAREAMPVKARVFIFIIFLFALCFAFNNQSSSALHKENNNSETIAKASPTPKSNKPRKQRSRRKSEQFMREPPRANLTTSSNVVYLPCDDGNYSSECPNNQVISVAAVASDPDGERIIYTYNVTVGKIIGEGGNVEWDLSGVPEGKYKITVTVRYKNGYEIKQEKEIEVAKCKCKPAQTSLDSVEKENNTKTETTSPPLDKSNEPNRFIFGFPISGTIKKKRTIIPPTNRAPTLESRLSSFIVALPCNNEKLSATNLVERNFLIDVFVSASDPDGDTLLYTYVVSVGKIIGNGPNVQWDLSGVQEGKYKVTLIVDDGKGYVVTQEKEIEVIKCKPTLILLDSVNNFNNAITISNDFDFAPQGALRK